jgi:hypothetical protein
MRTRNVVVLCASAAALLAPAVPASGKAVCNLVSDKPGDAVLGLGGQGAPAPAFDILSYDVATGKQTLVAVLRLKSTDAKADNAAALGIAWTVTFHVGDKSYSFEHRLGPQASGGAVTDTANVDGAPLAGVKVTVAPGAITWTVPRASITPLKAKNAYVTGFFSQASSSLSHDWAPDSGTGSGVRYPDRAASCVKAS